MKKERIKAFDNVLNAADVRVKAGHSRSCVWNPCTCGHYALVAALRDYYEQNFCNSARSVQSE